MLSWVHLLCVSLRSRRTCSPHGGCATDRGGAPRVVGLIRYWAWGWCVLAVSGRGSLCRRVHRVGDVEVAYDVHPVPGFTSFTAREMAQSLCEPHVPVVDGFKVGSHSLEGFTFSPMGGRLVGVLHSRYQHTALNIQHTL